MSGFDEFGEFGEIVKEKDNLIALQERDMDALKREIKSLKQQISRFQDKKK